MQICFFCFALHAIHG
jgi:hypothetical protein